MQSGDWDRLADPFPSDSVAWRVEELTPDRRSARLRPYLPLAAIVARLDEVAGRPGWSLRYQPIGQGVGCELAVAGAVRSAVAEARLPDEGLEQLSETALARAAELFGLLPPVVLGESHWVDYDPQERLALLPEATARGAAVAEAESAMVDRAEGPEPVKPEGQQAIDRLVERLKVEGRGLEAARLLVEYGGYGGDPRAARELYGRLRDLLTSRAESSA